MRQSLRVQDVVVHGESEGKTFYEIIEAGVAQGMQTFDTSIIEVYEKGLITEETAIAFASSRSVVFRGIDRIKNARGEKTTDLGDLIIDRDYDRRVKTGRS
jgi:twitching motility protein PilT